VQPASTASRRGAGAPLARELDRETNGCAAAWRRVRGAEHPFYESLDAVLQVLTLRDREIHDHAHRVEELSLRLARRLNRGSDEIDNLRRAACCTISAGWRCRRAVSASRGRSRPRIQVLWREGPHIHLRAAARFARI